MKRRRLMIAIGLLAAGLIAWWLNILGALAVGWASFLLRVGPRLTFDRASLYYAAFSLLLLFYGVHLIAGWLYRQMSPNEPRLWRWRSSAAIVGAVLALFTASIAFVGIVHQGTWLMTREPEWYEPRARIYNSGQEWELRRIAMGLLTYHDVHKTFPKGGEYNAAGEDLHGWALSVAPYMNYSLYGVDQTKPWNRPPNTEILRAALPSLQNPAFFEMDREDFGVSHYAANQYVMGQEHALRVDDLKGSASETLLVGEINANFQPWASSRNCRDPLLGINQSPDGFGGTRGRHGAYFAMADGSVRFVPEDVDSALLRKMSAVDVAKEK